MKRVVVNISDSVDLSKVNNIKLYIRYCKDNNEYSYVTEGFSIEENPKGEWKVITNYRGIATSFQCSKCKHCISVHYDEIDEHNIKIRKPKFCEECGADMRKGE